MYVFENVVFVHRPVESQRSTNKCGGTDQNATAHELERVTVTEIDADVKMKSVCRAVDGIDHGGTAPAAVFEEYLDNDGGVGLDGR